jgi:NADPH:quinone reductase-like Zn-dependent oxidoreductase
MALARFGALYLRSRMKAVVYDNYGPPDVLRIEEVAAPEPNDDEILVAIRATTVTRTDTHARAGEPFISRFFTGLRRPKRKIGGIEYAGEVVAVGKAVTQFEVGDEVFGFSGIFGPNAGRFGTHAQLICVREIGPVAHKPAAMSFEEAAAVSDGGVLALFSLRHAALKEGQKILVYGASGSIGTATVQVAKALGADVTGVCNTKNVELVKNLGADPVIDYTQEDFTENGKTYDVVFDAVGKQTFHRCGGSLKPGGRYVASDGLRNIVLAPWTSRFGDRTVVFPIPPRYTKKDLLFLKELIEAGKYRPVIDRVYPMEQVIEASEYVETRQKTGNVVLTVSGGE